MVKEFYRRALPQSLRIRLRRGFDNLFCNDYPDKVTLGKRCPWTVLKGGLGPNSVVYSGGVGEDISFETELIEQFGLTIQIYDPSPMALETLAGIGDAHKKSLRFQPLGLADVSEVKGFDPTIGELEHFQKGTSVKFNCTTLKEEMRVNRHDRIDLLKIDIEGFEYEVLEGCIRDGILPAQICVEFHNFAGIRPWTDTVSLLWKFRRLGYRIIHKSQYDYTMVRESGR